ncbi:hypothetical protein OAE63_00580 [bacterium]|nr:hypothetical protein [bacterium]
MKFRLFALMSCLLTPAAFAQALAANTQFVLVDRTVNVEAAPIIVAKDAPPFTPEAVAVLADYVEKSVVRVLK